MKGFFNQHFIDYRKILQVSKTFPSSETVSKVSFFLIVKPFDQPVRKLIAINFTFYTFCCKIPKQRLFGSSLILLVLVLAFSKRFSIFGLTFLYNSYFSYAMIHILHSQYTDLLVLIFPVRFIFASFFFWTKTMINMYFIS